MTLPKLPVVSGIELIKVISKIGFKVDHQTGSHIILRQNEYPHRRLTIPNHKEISKGTLKTILKQTGLTVTDLTELL